LGGAVEIEIGIEIENNDPGPDFDSDEQPASNQQPASSTQPIGCADEGSASSAALAIRILRPGRGMTVSHPTVMPAQTGIQAVKV